MAEARGFTAPAVGAGVRRCLVNRKALQDKWNDVKHEVRKQWAKLTDEQLDEIGGRYEDLTDAIRDAYGYTIEKARHEVDVFLEKLSKDSH